MSTPVRRGEVWEYTIGPNRRRGVVISSDAYNTSGDLIWALTIVASQNRGGYNVVLAPDDPGRPGVVVVSQLTRVEPTAFRRLLGPLSPTTFTAVEVTFRTVAGLT